MKQNARLSLASEWGKGAPTAIQTEPLPDGAPPKTHRSLELITEPLVEMARRCPSLIACEPGRFALAGQNHELPRFLFLGPPGGAEPLRIGLFAGLHGDQPATSFALLRFARLLEDNPEMARGYRLYLYPVANPTGFADNTSHNRNGKDLNREFWQNSAQPEVRLLESELWTHAFHGLLSLHADATNDGLYGYARGSVLTEHLLRPALAAAAQFLPRNQQEFIGGFRAQDGIVRGGHEGVLRAPPGCQPRPFEVTLEMPRHAPQFLQEAALAIALGTVLDEYRRFIAHAQNL